MLEIPFEANGVSTSFDEVCSQNTYPPRSQFKSQHFRNQRRTSKIFGISGPHRGYRTSKKARVSSSEVDDEVPQRRTLNFFPLLRRRLYHQQHMQIL